MRLVLLGDLFFAFERMSSFENYCLVEVVQMRDEGDVRVYLRRAGFDAVEVVLEVFAVLKHQVGDEDRRSTRNALV